MKNLRKALCLVLAVVLVCGVLTCLVPGALAVETTYQLADLLTNKQIKALGRTQVNPDSTGIMVDWSGTGFEITTTGSGTMTVGYKSSHDSYWVALVDGEQTWRGWTAASTAGSTFAFSVPAGTHTVSVIKETQIHSTEGYYFDLTTLAWSGTIGAAPGAKDLYIEFIGDSYSCGDGALGEYEIGKTWVGSHDSATHGFPWYTAQTLGADYSIVARGGIGLFDGTSAQEGTDNKVTMTDIYPYAGGYRDMTEAAAYGFARQPNIVVVHLGANDGIDATNKYKTIAVWEEKLTELLALVREKNPNATIVCMNHDATKYGVMLKVTQAMDNAYACYYSHHGNGGAALATQREGHPDYEDHKLMAKNLINFIRSQGLVTEQTEQTDYTETVYYVSQSGSDSNAGTSADAPKLTVPSALSAANTKTYAPGSRIVINVTGEVVCATGQSVGIQIKDTAGNLVPIVLQTYQFDGTNRAVLKNTFKPTNDGSSNTYAQTHLTLRNVTYKTMKNGNFCAASLYSAGCDLVLDNAQLVAESGKAFAVGADNFARGGRLGNDANVTLTGSVTFLNGDYTAMGIVSAVRGGGVYRSAAEGGNITAYPNMTAKLIIGEGAKMGTIYGNYGTMSVGSTVIEVRPGATVAKLQGTGNSNTYAANLSVNISGGNIGGFWGTGSSATVNGSITNNISGGYFFATPTRNNENFYLAGGPSAQITGDVTNNISGGQFTVQKNSEQWTADTDYTYEIVFGIYGGKLTGNLINNISGGNFAVVNGAVTGGNPSIHLGNRSGAITGELRNTITAGSFGGAVIYFGGRATDTNVSKIINVIGVQDDLGKNFGPRFLGTVNLAGNWGRIGGTESTQPTEADCSDTVVVSNTIYSGYFSSTVRGGTSCNYSSIVTYIKGSIENNIYGGVYASDFIGSRGYVYGKVTTNVYGGSFQNLYGGADAGSKVFDGVELNIYSMKDFYLCNSSGTVSGISSGTVVTQTAGRDAVKLNIAPQEPDDLTIRAAIQLNMTASTVTGTKSAAVSGGTFPRGFAISGLTVGEALAEGCGVYDYIKDTKLTYANADASVSGKVVVRGDDQTFTRDLVYYVSETGNNTFSGSNPEVPKQTLASVVSKVNSDVGGTNNYSVRDRVIIYVTGKVVGSTSQNFADYTPRANGLSVPVVITTYGYDAAKDNKATVMANFNNSGAASMYISTDYTFRDIELKAGKNSSGTFFKNFYTSGSNLVLDNCAMTTEGSQNWTLSTDGFARSGRIMEGATREWHSTITLKNGDYTNLYRLAVINDNYLWVADTYTGEDNDIKELPYLHCKITVEDGAKVGQLIAAYGALKVASVDVEILGGTVAGYVGTNNGTSSTDRKSYQTDINVLVDGGIITGKFYGTGNNVNFTGDLTNTVKSGGIQVTSTAAENNIYFGGGNTVTINGNVTNTISGGTLKVTNGGKDTEIVFGGRNAVVITGNLTNTISGGTIGLDKASDGTSAGTHGVYLGNWVGDTRGTMTNTITGGTFDGTMDFNVYFGGRGIDCDTGKIVNVIGDQQTGEGPGFYNGSPILLSGGWGRIGVSDHTALPTDNGTHTAISNTIYGGVFDKTVHVGVTSGANTGSIGYVYGNIENHIYGGTFNSNFCAASYNNAKTFGNVTTVIAPENSDDLVIRGTIYSGSANVNTGATATLTISGGHYPSGLKVSGTTVGEALADGYTCWVHDSVADFESKATTVSGDVYVDPMGVAKVNGVIYTTLADALAEAESENGTVVLATDMDMGSILDVDSDITLDLNGNLVTTKNALVFGYVTDNTEGQGGIVMSNDRTQAVLLVQADNPQVPLYDEENGCYRLYSYEQTELGSYEVGTNVQKFGFRLLLPNAKAYELLADAADQDLRLILELTVPTMASLNIRYEYDSKQIQDYAGYAAAQLNNPEIGYVKTAFTLTVAGLGSLGENDVLTITPRFQNCGLDVQGEVARWPE